MALKLIMTKLFLNGYFIQLVKKYIYSKETYKNIEINKSAFKEGLGKEEDVKRECSISFTSCDTWQRNINKHS